MLCRYNNTIILISYNNYVTNTQIILLICAHLCEEKTRTSCNSCFTISAKLLIFKNHLHVLIKITPFSKVFCYVTKFLQTDRKKMLLFPCNDLKNCCIKSCKAPLINEYWPVRGQQKLLCQRTVACHLLELHSLTTQHSHNGPKCSLQKEILKILNTNSGQLIRVTTSIQLYILVFHVDTQLKFTEIIYSCILTKHNSNLLKWYILVIHVDTKLKFTTMIYSWNSCQQTTQVYYNDIFLHFILADNSSY